MSTRCIARACAIFVMILAAVVGASPAARAQNITNVSNENKAVNAAIAEAQSKLPVFFERLANPQPGDYGFSVKLRYDVGNNNGEHIWGADPVRSGDTVTATIANVPRNIKNLSKGDRVTVPITRITDWLFERDGKYHGAYTVRALLPFMKKDEAANMRKRLAPL